MLNPTRLTMQHAALVFLVSLFLIACKTNNIYEKNKVIPGHSWQSKYQIRDSFEITDTSSLYNIYLSLRHTDAYLYNNIWLNLGLKKNGDTMSYQKANFILGNDATGWEGTGMDDIWEMRKKINHLPFRFHNKGVYEFSIQQIMREDPLNGIMSVGLRLQRVEE